MLSTNVKAVSDLMSIALLAEREAIRRYSELAEKMREGNNETTAALFERMVLEEQEHEDLLLKWMAQEGIEENDNIGPISWRDPNISTTYDKEACNTHYSSPYKALAFAVHNEEIAFSFYTHVAAHSENKAVREYAEILAREELAHAALLRAERRRAYHAERKNNITGPVLDHRVIQSESDLLATAIYIDHYLANEVNLASKHHPELRALAEEIQQQIEKNEHALENKASPTKDTTNNLEQLALQDTHARNEQDNPEQRLQRLWADCDRSFAFYDAIVENSADEAIMFTAQQLTSSALDRIGILKQILGDATAVE